MNKRTKGAILAAAVVAGGVSTGVAVHAASTPPWQAAAIHSPHAVGSVSLINADGAPVVSGSIDQPLAAYAVASGGLVTGPSASTVATLGIYTPTSVVSAPVAPPTFDTSSWEGAAAFKSVGPDSWTGTAVSAPTVQTVGFPAGVSGPAAKLDGSVTLKQYIAGYANTLTATPYADVYELRLSTGIAGRALSEDYAVLDIQVSGNTWHLYGEGPSSAVATTLTLASAPASVTAGTPVTLTATVAPAAPGTVQFKQGSTPIGAAVPVVDGKATTPFTTTTLGSIALSAEFTPTDIDAYRPSTATGSVTVLGAGPSADCIAAAKTASAAAAALATATTKLSAANASVASLVKPAAVKSLVKANAKVTSAQAKAKKAEAKVKAAKTAKAKKKAKAAAKKAKTAVKTAQKAAKKAAKKAGSAGTAYASAIKAQASALAAQKSAAAASAKAAAAKAAACK